MRIRSLQQATLACLLLVGLFGCSEETRPKLKGTVTYNGQPLADKSLILSLQTDPGVSQTLALQSDGSFEGEAPISGTYKVVIAESRAVMEGMGKARKDGPKVASKYASAKTSDAVVTIDRGVNVRKIELKD
jgi:hypothetical protein